jgi:hypothetical protein
MVITGISTLGNWSMESCRKEKSPKTTRASIITAAKTGLFMDRSERTMVYLPS